MLENGTEASMISSVSSLHEQSFEEHEILKTSSGGLILDDASKVIGGRLSSLVEHLTTHESNQGKLEFNKI